MTVQCTVLSDGAIKVSDVGCRGLTLMNVEGDAQSTSSLHSRTRIHF